MIKLIPATLTDIPTIFSLAEKIWHDHYISIISKEQITYMLDKFYSEEALKEQMVGGQMFYLIVEHDELPLGYVAFTEKEPACWFMNKFYIKTENQGQGTGAKVLKEWEERVSPKELSLQVNRKNYKSINFYFKTGFKIRQVADFDIGHGFFMDDYIMEKVY